MTLLMDMPTKLVQQARNQIKQLLSDGVPLAQIVSQQFFIPVKQVEELIIEEAEKLKPTKHEAIKLAPMRGGHQREFSHEQRALQQSVEYFEDEDSPLVSAILEEVVAVRRGECTDTAIVESHKPYAHLTIVDAVCDLALVRHQIAKTHAQLLANSLIVKKVRAQ